MQEVPGRCAVAAVWLGCALAAGAAEAQGLRWRNIGPGGGGWMTCLTVDPKDPDTVYAGCDVGGFYKSTDAGAHWTISNKGLTADYVEKILVHPSDTRVLYIAGCGGVFRSDDGGGSWRWLRDGFPPPAASRYSAPVGALAINPDDPRMLYAGIGFPRKFSDGNGVVYKTTDGGGHWSPLAGIQAMAGDACFHAIVLRPGRPREILAATTRGLFLSEDAGASWRKAGAGLPVEHVTDAAFSPANPDIVYATVWTPPGEAPWRGGVHRSADGGRTFVPVSEGLPHAVGKPGGSPHLTCNFLKVAASPHDADLVYAGASSWVGAGLFRSKDGGRHWELVTRKSGTGPLNVDSGWITMGGNPGIKCVAVSPHNPGRLYVGTSMHVYRSDDSGGSWRQCVTSEAKPGWWTGNGMETTCIQHIAVDPTDGRRMYFGYADVGILFTEDGGASFQRRVEGIPWHGDMASVAIDPKRPSVLWCGMGKAAVPGGGVAKSEDFGRAWNVVGKPETGLPNATTARIVLDPSSPAESRTLYVTSAGNGIFRSDDGGAAWRPASDGLGAGADATWIALDPADPSRVYATLRHTKADPCGGVFRSDDRGRTWTKINRDAEFPEPFCLAIDPRQPAVLFLAARGHFDRQARKECPGGVFRSADGGATWTRVIEDRFASSVLVSPVDSKVVYAGLTAHPYHDNCLGGGLLRSADGGITWRAENEGLTVTQVGTIVCDPSDPTVLFIGTGGNGVFTAVDAALKR